LFVFVLLSAKNIILVRDWRCWILSQSVACPEDDACSEVSDVTFYSC